MPALFLTPPVGRRFSLSADAFDRLLSFIVAMSILLAVVGMTCSH